MGWWEKADGQYLYAEDWNKHIKEVFTKIENKRKLYFGKIENDFAQYFGGILAFPASATVYAANEHGVITLKPFAKVQGKDGELALYSPIPSADATMPNSKDLRPSGWMGFFGDDYVDCGSGIDVANNNFTVAFKMKMDSPPDTSSNIIVAQAGGNFSGGDTGWRVLISTEGRISVGLSDGTNYIGNVQVGATNVCDGKWHTIVVLFDRVNNTVSVYVDKVLDGTLDISSITGSLSSTAKLGVGAGITDTGTTYLEMEHGYVAYVWLWNGYLLSESEIASVTERPDDPVTTNLVLNLNPTTIDEVNGLWKDASGNGNDGTIHGAVGCVPSDLTYIEDAYRLQAGKLDAQNERKEWWFKVGEDILPGKYKLVFRVKDTDNVADDVKVTVTNVSDGSELWSGTFTLSGTDWQNVESDVIDLSGLRGKWVEVRIEKATAEANTVYVDYVTLDPYGWVPEVYYVVPDEDRHIGEVKVWDTMGSDNEADWVRVFNKEHKFVGDMVIEADSFRYKFGDYCVTVYVWNGSLWEECGFMALRSANSKYSEIEDVQLLEVSKEYVKLRIKLKDVQSGGHVVERWKINSVGVFGEIEEVYNLSEYSTFARSISTIDKRIQVTFGSEPFEILAYNLEPTKTDVNDWNMMLSVTKPVLLTKSFGRAVTWIMGLGLRTSTLTGWKFDETAWIRFDQYANLFKEAENTTLSTAPSPLTYTDDFSEDTSARYMLDSDLFTWDTANGIVTTTTAPAKTVLRSLKFAHGDYYLKVKTGTGGKAGLLLKWQPTKDSGYIVRIDETNDVVELVRVDNGTETVLASGTTTIDADTWYDLHVNVDSAGTFTVELNGSTVISGVSDVAYDHGYVGLYNGAGSSAYDDLQVTAHEVVGRGAQVNRFIDDFDWDSSAEYTVVVGSGWSWDTTKGVVKVFSDTSNVTLLRLNSLKFASGSYNVDVKINCTDAVDRTVGIVFGMQDDQNYYFAHLIIKSNDSAGIDMYKMENGSPILLSTASITATTGEFYNLRVEWDDSTGEINIYFNGSKTLSVTDATFRSGYVGLRVDSGSIIDVEFDNLEIQADEVTSSGNTCVLLGGVNHGGRTTGVADESSYKFTVGTDIPKGRYLSVVRIKTTDTSNTSGTFGAVNISDNQPIGIDGLAKYQSLASYTLSESYTYIIRPIELGDDDDTDQAQIGIFRGGGVVEMPILAVDYFLLVPISGLESQTLMPQDIAVRSMVHTEYVDDAVDKAFDIRDEYIEPRKPVRELTAYKVDAQSAKADKIQIGFVKGDYGSDWSGFDPTTALADYAEDGAMVLVVNTNATASPKMKLYAYHSDVGWEVV